MYSQDPQGDGKIARLLRFRNEADFDAVGIRIYFGFTNGTLGREFSLLDSPGLTVVKVERVGDTNLFEVRWDGTLESKEGLDLRVPYGGTPPYVHEYRWITREDENREEDLAAALTLRQVFEQRAEIVRQWLTDDPDDFDARIHAFFLDLDARTRESDEPREALLLPPSLLAEGYGDLASTLVGRVSDRAGGVAEQNLSTKGFDSDDPHGSAIATEYSELMLVLIRTHFGRILPFEGEENGPGLAGFETAFEKFSNGMLRHSETSKPHLLLDPYPDSSFYFLFAEFALACIQVGVNGDEWARLLNVLVRTQEVFAKAYSPENLDESIMGSEARKLHWSNYLPGNLKSVDESEVEDLRSTYLGLSIQELAEKAGENAKMAFKDGFD